MAISARDLYAGHDKSFRQGICRKSVMVSYGESVESCSPNIRKEFVGARVSVMRCHGVNVQVKFQFQVLRFSLFLLAVI